MSPRVKRLLNGLGKLEIPHGPLTEFHYFTKLPKELQVKVMKLAAQVERIIKLDSVEAMNDSYIPWTQGEIPSKLLVSKELLQEGIKYYQRSYQHGVYEGRDWDSERIIYINFEIDQFLKRYSGDKWSFDKEILDKVSRKC